MSPHEHITQCLQCGRVKENGRWAILEIPALADKVSHTYCDLCLSAIQSRLVTLREFQSWDFPIQVEYLRHELAAKNHNHYDGPGLTTFLEETFGITGPQATAFCEALKPQLVRLACPRCRQEILPNQKSLRLGNRPFHLACHGELKGKIRILLENNWDTSGKLDAYLDLLQVEKSIRAIVKAELRARRGAEMETQPALVTLRV